MRFRIPMPLLDPKAFSGSPTPAPPPQDGSADERRAGDRATTKTERGAKTERRSDGETE